MIYSVRLLIPLILTFSINVIHSADKVGSQRPVRFTILGERCCGTNYVCSLVKKNFPELTNTDYTHKHFHPWFDLSITGEKNLVRTNDLSNKYNNSERVLFLIVTRNPYDWIRSFHREPNHVSNKIKGLDLLHFMKVQFAAVPGGNCADEDANEMDNFNPYKNRPFKNVFELRKYKILNYLEILNYVENAVIVNYDRVISNPQKFLDFLSEKYSLQRSQSYDKVDSYKGNGRRPFQNSRYKRFSSKEYHLLNNLVDWDVEFLINYRKRSIRSLSD